MRISGLQKVSLIDYPGKIAATVFLAGCNFRCPWCHNPELVVPEIIGEQAPILEKDFFRFLKERRGLLEGVVITGGEPCLNNDLPDFCRKIKEAGFEVKLDTNGSQPEMLNQLIDSRLIDYVAMDIKAPKEKYPKAIGLADISPNFLVSKIDQSIALLKNSDLDFEFRTTVTPTILTKRDILKIVRWIKPAKRYVLQNFRPQLTLDPGFQKLKPYSEELLHSWKEAIAPFFTIVEVR